MILQGLEFRPPGTRQPEWLSFSRLKENLHKLLRKKSLKPEARCLMPDA